MWKFLLVVLLVGFGTQYGVTYLLSDDFQRYADGSGAQWTCQLNNVFGGIYFMTGKYKKALPLYKPVLKRCPGTTMAEKAEFNICRILEKTNVRQAIAAYENFAQRYPKTNRAKLAQRAATVLSQNL